MSNEEGKTVTAETAPAPKKSNKTALIIVLSILGVVILCTLLNVIGNNLNSITPTPTVLPTLDLTPVMAQVATVFVNLFGPNIDTTSGQVQALECAQYTGRKLVLPGGDSAFIPCPADSATLSSIGADKLPGPLDAGLTFVSGLDVAVSPSLSGTLRLSVHFVVPAEHINDKLTILHWDGTKWEDLGPLQTIDAQATTAGVFVLAGK